MRPAHSTNISATARAALLGVVAVLVAGVLGCDRHTEGPPVLRASYGSSDDFDAFSAYLWCEPGHAGPLPASWRTAFGGVEATRGVAPAAAVDWRSYVGQAAGRGELHLDRADVAQRREEWLKERGDTLPVRPFDVRDATTVERLTARVVAHTLARPGADFVALGDEIGATPYGDPLDFASRAGAVATDALLGLLAEPDAAAFCARRESERVVWLELLDHLADAARTARPDARIGLLGIGPRTPFALLDARDLVDRFDVLEPYDEGMAREAVATLAGGDTTLLRTVFTESGPSVAWQVFEHALRGGDGVVLWQRSELLARPAVADELARALATVRALRTRFAGIGARPRTVAVLTDGTGDATLWLRAARRERLHWPQRSAGHEAREGPAFRRRVAYVDAFEEVGASPGVIDVAELENAATSARFPLLVASGLDLERAEVHAALKSHLERGGWLVLDDVWSSTALPRADHILAPPAGLDESRLAGPSASPRALRRRRALTQMLALAAPAAPVEILAASGAPLFTNSTLLADGSTLVVAIQACQSAEDRARLEPWLAQATPAAGARGVTWQWVGATADEIGGTGAPLELPAGWPAILLVSAVQTQ